jgi:predicted transcriptional regulator of viral defense system
LAARQHGVVSHAQLVELGFGAGAIKYRRGVGRLHLLHRGVYAVGHRPPSPLATAMAAVLACGPDAALSHGSAAALWRIVPRWPTPTHVTAPSERDRPGIHVHRSRHADTTTHYGIRVTTPARTLVDLADVLTPRQLTRAVNEARVQRLVTAEELTTLLTRLHPTSPASSSATASRSPSPTKPSPATKSTRVRTRPRPRRRPPHCRVLDAPHHRPPPQTPPRQRRTTPQIPRPATRGS